MNAAQTSATTNWGQPISNHQLTFRRKWGGLGVGFVLVCLGPILYIGLTAWFAKVRPAMAQVGQDMPIYQYLPLLLGIISTVSGLLYLLNLRRNWPLAVTVYEKGIVYQDRHGQRLMPWETIDEMYQQVVRHYYSFIPVGTTYWFTLRGQDQPMIQLDNRLSRIKALSQLVMRRVSETQAPRLISQVKAGQVVKFGPLMLDIEGISYAGNKLRWDEVKEIQVGGGTVAILKKGTRWITWASLPSVSVPNLPVLCEIAGTYTQVR